MANTGKEPASSCSVPVGSDSGNHFPVFRNSGEQQQKSVLQACGACRGTVLILGLYLFKYEAPWLYRSHRSDERIQYRVPHEEMVLTFYQRTNGDLSVSHKYISAEYFLNAEVRLPDYRNTPWLRQNRKEYMEDWPGQADLEMIQGRTWLIPSDEEQILCIDRNHSLHADPDGYLEEMDDLWMITVCRP
ncbi:MAG: hypothetical protein IIY52_00380 [Solobacterium sp.]|nr:hypothetical protein [Solobacterium sp.]